MKSFVYAMVAASALSVPLASFAQSTSTENGPVTRAQVRQELIQLQRAGYNANEADPSYPSNLQAAERRVNEEQGSAVAAGDTSGTSGYGGVQAGSAQSGAPMQAQPMNVDGVHPLYFGR